MASVTVGVDLNGNQKRRSFYGKTQKEALDKKNRALGEMLAGTYIDPNKVTVGEWLDTWLEQYVKPSLRPKTHQNYEGSVRLQIKPSLGGVKLAKLQPSHVQAMVNDLMKSGLSARTASLAQVVLHSALKQAVSNGLVMRNAADGTRKPKGGRRPPRVLTQEEQAALLAVAKEDRLGPMFAVMLGTGLRLGEAVALRWQDVDMPKKTMRVVQSASRVTLKGAKSKLAVQPPKTKAGVRSIPLPAFVITALREWKGTQSAEHLRIGPAWTDSGFVFTTSTGKMLEPRVAQRKLDALTKKAAIDHVNVHALRHTCATRMLEAGVDLNVIKDVLGHSSIAMTGDIYAHVLPNLKQRAADALDAAFSW